SISREAVLPILLKLFVLPPVIAGLAFAAGISGLPLTVAVIAAAMPTGANAFLVSRRAVGFLQASASTVVVTTIASVVPLSSLQPRDRLQEKPCIGMTRPGEQAVRFGDLDEAAEIHDADAVRHLVDHRQIVRDEQVGQAEFALEILHQVEDLRLYRNVERRRRL